MKNIYKFFGGRKAFFVLLLILIWFSTLFISKDIFIEIHRAVIIFLGAYLGFNVYQKNIEKGHDDTDTVD